MGEIDAKTLGKRIREARKRADILQEDLGRSVGLERSMVAKIESGDRKVTALELSDIAASLGVMMSSFFKAPTPALVSHRSSQGLDTVDSKIDALLAKLATDVEFVCTLKTDWLTVPPAGQSVVTPSSAAEAEALARTARRLMGLDPVGPIRDLTKAVSDIGLLAFSADIGKDTADAGTIALRSGAVSLINSHMKVGRRRLALAHELGHYLISDKYTVDWRVDQAANEVPTEARLDRFARALLLPEGAMTESWFQRASEVGDRSAAIAIASEFRVDMATLATRLRELRVLDADAANAIRGYRTKQADIIDLDLYVPEEEMAGTTVPRIFARTVLSLIRQQRISRERGLGLLLGTVDESGLLEPHERRRDEIWDYVS